MSDLGGSLLVPSIRLPEDYGRLDELIEMAMELSVAGFIVYGGDVELTPPFLAILKKAAGRPLLLMADYERGAGLHVIGMPELPPAMALGASDSAELAWMAGKITALSAREVGVNVVLAPVLDILSEIANPIIGSRAFAGEPDLVTHLGLAFAEGVQDEGVIACAKHFPGHGDTTRDSHTALPVVEASLELLRTREFVPFRAASRAGVGMMMTAHVVYPALDPDVPATFSRKIMTDLLREDWGYPGLLVTDALTMEGAKGGDEDPGVRALAAGADLLLGPGDPFAQAEAVRTALEAGRVSEEALAASRARVGIAAADLVFEAPVPRELDRETAFTIDRMARGALTLASDPHGLLAGPAPGVATMGVVVDDDGLPARGRAFDERREDFPGGILHVTPDGIGEGGDPAEALREADRIVLGLFGDAIVAKERATLHPALEGFTNAVLGEHGAKTVVVIFGNPCLARGLPPCSLVFAYGEAEACRNAALDVVLAGGEFPGTLPVTVSEKLPRGTGRGES